MEKIEILVVIKKINFKIFCTNIFQDLKLIIFYFEYFFQAIHLSYQE